MSEKNFNYTFLNLTKTDFTATITGICFLPFNNSVYAFSVLMPKTLSVLRSRFCQLVFRPGGCAFNDTGMLIANNRKALFKSLNLMVSFCMIG